MSLSAADKLVNLPVIIGSSFSGMLLSLQLSESGIGHVLIGGEEPNDVPRLGESMNECASAEIFGRFGEAHPDCFFTKSHISLLNGEYATQIQIADPRRCHKMTSRYNTSSGCWPHKRSRTFWGSVTGRNLMHVDRIKLDPILYRKVLNHQQCHFIKSLVHQVAFANDTVTKIHLEDGTLIESPKYVMDATGFRGVIARTAEVGLQPLGETQRVVWTHLHCPAEAELPRRWWRQGTNLLKLEEAIDGYDGISWLIPIGEYISIGVSMDHDRFSADTFDKAEVVRLLGEAYRRRGVDCQEIFPEQRRQIVELTHRYYIRDRAFGLNWLLVGGTYVSVWFPSSAGLWTTIAACRLVTRLFDNPQELGARYEATLKPLLGFHDHLEEMIHFKTFRSHKHALRFWSRWLSDVPTRLGLYLDLPEPGKPDLPARFQFMRTLGSICRRYPFLQRFFWGNSVTRTSYRPDLAQQSAAFGGYFLPFLFRTKNYIVNSIRWLNPF